MGLHHHDVSSNTQHLSDFFLALEHYFKRVALHKQVALMAVGLVDTSNYLWAGARAGDAPAKSPAGPECGKGGPSPLLAYSRPIHELGFQPHFKELS